MTKGAARRQELLERMADHILAHGLQSASLRLLAAAVGTSDRMLLHYFADKEELLAATLTLLAQRLIAIMERTRAERLPFEDLLPLLAMLMKDDAVQPYLRLWLELVAHAVRGQEPFRAIARQIGDTFLHWIAAALRVEREEDRAPLAALALATVEGLILFDALGDDAKIKAALAGVGREARG